MAGAKEPGPGPGEYGGPYGQADPSAHQLRLFLALADELHFGRAAKRVFMTQPAFSQQIRSLERRLGLELVDRTTRRVALTASGRALLPEARAMVEAADRLRQTAEQEAHAVSGRVVIGSLEAVTAMPPIPEVLEQLRSRCPHMDIQVLRTGFADFADALLQGEVDASFVFLPVPEGIQVQTLDSGPRCAVMAAHDPLASQGPLTLDQLSDRTFIGWSPRIPKVWRDFWSADPRPDGSPVRYSPHAVTDYESALSVIALGEGIEFPPDSARRLYPRPGVSYVDVTGLPPWTTALAWLPKNRDKPFVAALRQAVRTVLRRQGVTVAVPGR
ncbi:LysR family transcriptional regulator [Streptomyces sp. 7N604]|uniref:LysR family transcriptional regulator n=1 Tax=Streptomyces sp. 7N604 TaxID=3457415 RepID=UPI003FD39572